MLGDKLLDFRTFVKREERVIWGFSVGRYISDTLFIIGNYG